MVLRALAGWRIMNKLFNKAPHRCEVCNCIIRQQSPCELEQHILCPAHYEQALASFQWLTYMIVDTLSAQELRKLADAVVECLRIEYQ